MLAAGLYALIVIPLCLIIAALIGVWQGFWIGHVHVPPFICTLAGMFLFRGLARAILGSKTVTVSDNTFLDIFASYINIPGIDDGDVKWSAFFAGCIAALLIIVQKCITRSNRTKKGYKQESIVSEFTKLAVVDVLIMAYTWQLAHFRGISVMALWVTAIVCVYEFLTSVWISISS